MNRFPERFSQIGVAGLILVLLLIWSFMTLAYAYNQGLGYMNASFDRAVVAVNMLDGIRGSVDRLNLDLRAFLATGDARFQDGIWSAVVNLQTYVDQLNDLAAAQGAQGARAVRLSATISRMLGSVAQSYDIRDQRGARAALAFFDANESLSSRAKSEADELQTQIIADISSRIRAARGNKGLLEAILHAAPAGFGLRPARAARALAMAR